MRGTRLHTGEKKGMPFQISTSPSPVPIFPRNPATAVRGNTA